MANPNSLLTILDSQDASADFESSPIDCASADRAFIQLTTSDTMTGVLKVQATNDIMTSWDDLEDIDHTVDGIKTSYSWNLNGLAMKFIRVKFIFGSGVGTFSGTCHLVDDQ